MPRAPYARHRNRRTSGAAGASTRFVGKERIVNLENIRTSINNAAQGRNPVMTHTPNTITGPDEPKIYTIRVKGQLSTRWERWFSPMTVTPQPNGDTLLTGPIVDQAALHGILKRIRDLGLPLVSVAVTDSNQANRLDGEKG
jgi:hypothetical protein